VKVLAANLDYSRERFPQRARYILAIRTKNGKDKVFKVPERSNRLD
jgi:hypothetical protein